MVEYLKQWQVESSDGKRTYAVSVTKDGAWSCSCVGWTRHTPRRDCKHIKEIKAENQNRLIQFGDSVQAVINAIDRAEGLSARQLVEQKGLSKADAARVKREEVAAKKQKALGKIRYGFQLAETYEPEDMARGKWVAEVKFDGELGMLIDGHIINRSGRDVTHRFPEISKVSDAVLVGELCVFGPDGLTVFKHIQERNTDDEEKIRFIARQTPAVFMAFDILEFKGQSLTEQSFEMRRKTLEGYFKTYGKNLSGVKLVEQIPLSGDRDVQVLVNKLRELGGEGIMVKDLSAPWVAKRARGFVKAKTWQEREFQIVRHEYTGVGDGFVIYISNKGREQRVNMGDRRMREAVVASKKPLSVEIKFLSEGEDGALRFPSVRRLSSEIVR